MQDVRAHIARGLPTPLAGKAAQEIGFPEIVTAVRRKDRIVTEIFERWLDRFSATILNGFYAYTPDLILLAGGPTQAAGIFLRKLESAAQRHRVQGARRLPDSDPHRETGERELVRRRPPRARAIRRKIVLEVRRRVTTKYTKHTKGKCC